MKDFKCNIGEYGLYDYNVSTIKLMGDRMKVCELKAVRKSGLEVPKSYSPKCSVNEKKLDNNIARAKSKVQELVLCNEWDYFCTFTISPKKYNRMDLKKYYKDFSLFIQNYNRYCTEEEKVKYIFVPEMHNDGAWHIHGFLKGIRCNDLYKNKFGYLSWHSYEDKFGFISFDKVKNKERSASYILKYLTKDTSKNVSELDCHLYYASKGLKTAKTVFKGSLIMHCPWDYENDYCKIKFFNTSEGIYKYVMEIKK